MQLSFDFYDDEFEALCEEKHINHYLAKFILLLPEAILIMDTLLKFITGFYENGVIETEKSKIIEHYLKKGLIFDLLAYIPVLSQGFLRTSILNIPYINGTIIKLSQILLLCKIKRVGIALSNCQEIISANGRDDYTLSAIRLLLTILFVTHINACIWHSMAYFGSDKLNWLTFNNIHDSDWKYRYYVSMYWAISLFGSLGSGDKFSPHNLNEYILGIAIILISVFLFSYSFFTIKGILEAMNKDKKEYKSNFYIFFYNLSLNTEKLLK